VADRTLEIQAAIYAALVADAGVGALVGDKIYDAAYDPATATGTPVPPYITIGAVSAIPMDGTLLRGMEHLFDVHVWSEKPGAVECRQIMAAVYGALHWADLTLSAGTAVFCRMTSRRDFADPDGVTTHGVVTFEIITDG
jgi:hypothetical protein